MATGLLIVCVGRGTKAVDAFMAMQKQYSGTMRLGEGTPSQDAETPVEEHAPWEHITGVRAMPACLFALARVQLHESSRLLCAHVDRSW
jgi:hypothetical protein